MSRNTITTIIGTLIVIGVLVLAGFEQDFTWVHVGGVGVGLVFIAMFQPEWATIVAGVKELVKAWRGGAS